MNVRFSVPNAVDTSELVNGKNVDLTAAENTLKEGEKVSEKEAEEAFTKIKVGDFIGILPIHSCLTADAMKGYLTLEGLPLEHLEGTNYR